MRTKDVLQYFRYPFLPHRGIFASLCLFSKYSHDKLSEGLFALLAIYYEFKPRTILANIYHAFTLG